MDSSELWVIEAPGKIKILQKILEEIGIKAHLFATKGHLMASPSSLGNLGIDAAFNEHQRLPVNQEIIQRLRDQAATAPRIVVATDADAEGDVIAWDVANVIGAADHDIVRVRLRAINKEAVLQALSNATPVLMSEATPGRTRAILDRLIGATFSKSGVAVGRISTAILGMVSKKEISTLSLTLTAPAADGGRPWKATTMVMSPLDAAMARQLTALPWPALEATGDKKSVVTPLSHTGDILVRGAEKFNVSPGAIAKSMQSAYEAGELSYPRAGSRSIGDAAAKKIRAFFVAQGYRYDDRKLARPGPGDVHDAPYPINTVTVASDPERLGVAQGIVTMIAQGLLKCGQDYSAEIPDRAMIKRFLVQQGLDAIADYVAGLNWSRIRGPHIPGNEEAWAESGVATRRMDAVILEQMIKTGLGRPSTWGRHIDQFMGRNLVTASEDGRIVLTSKGQFWLQSSPSELADPAISAAIETICDHYESAIDENDSKQRDPWQALSEKIVDALPDRIRTAILKSVHKDMARPAPPTEDKTESSPTPTHYGATGL